MRTIFLSLCAILLCTNAFTQSQYELTKIIRELSTEKDRGELMMNIILLAEQAQITDSTSMVDRLTLLGTDKAIYEKYNNLKMAVDQLILGIESQLIIANKKLKKFNAYDCAADVKLIHECDSIFTHAYENYSPPLLPALAPAGSSLLPSTILPAPLDLFKDVTDFLGANRDFVASQTDKINELLDALKLSSVQELQNGGGSSSSDSKDSKTSKKKKGGTKGK